MFWIFCRFNVGRIGTYCQQTKTKVRSERMRRRWGVWNIRTRLPVISKVSKKRTKGSSLKNSIYLWYRRWKLVNDSGCRKIILEQTHVIKDSTSGYLYIKSARLEHKYGDLSPDSSFEQRHSRACLSVISPQNLIKHCLEDISTEVSGSTYRWELMHETVLVSDWVESDVSTPSTTSVVETGRVVHTFQTHARL